MKSSQKKAGKPGRTTWDLPVSRKFYEGLLGRVDEVIRAVFFDPSPEYFRLARRMIDCYLNDNLHAIPERDIIPEVRLIFLTLKAEIDQARERSLRARLVARRRTATREKKGDVEPRESMVHVIQSSIVERVGRVGPLGRVGRGVFS